MSFIADRVYQTAANPGSGAVTPNQSVAGYATFSSGVPNGSTLTIAIESQTPGDWELCDAVWDGTTLTRGLLLSSSTGSRVTFTGPVNVFSTASAKYINTPAGHADALGFTSTFSSTIVPTNASGTGSTATLTFADQTTAPYAVNSYIAVAGVSSSNYNGLYQVTGCTRTSVSYANTTTAAYSAANSASNTICQAVVLTKDSSFYQIIASGSNQSAFVLPDTSTLQKGWSFRITNGTSNSVLLQVYTSTGVLVASYGANQTYYFTCIDTAVNTAAAWRVSITDVGSATGSGSMVLSVSPTITGTMSFTGSTTSNAFFGTAQTTGQMQIGGNTSTTTGLIRLGQSTASQPIQIGTGATTTATTASGTSSSISGTVLTVGGTVTGTFSIGMALTGTGVLPNTFITSASGSTWNINQTQTVASTTITGTTQKSIHIGTGGNSGSITEITLGSATTGATSTTTVNGTLNTGTLNVAAGTSEQFRVSHTASAVNYVQVTGGTQGASVTIPTISVQGSDASPSLGITSKGSGSLVFFTNSSAQRQFRVSHTGSAVNYIDVTGSAAGQAPILSVTGTDNNIDLALTPKGTGVVVVNTNLGITSLTASTSATTADQVLATFDPTLYRTIKLTVQATYGTNYQSTEILAIHNGTTANHTEYGTVTIGSACASYTVDYFVGTPSTVRLLATPAFATATTYKIAAYLTKL